MQTVLRVQTKVKAGHRIEITAPELREGDTVEVTVQAPERAEPPRRSAMDIINSFPPGPRMFESWEEIDDYLQRERNSWDH